MAEKEKLMDDYHRMLHELAVARNPIEAETARNNYTVYFSVIAVECKELSAYDFIGKNDLAIFYVFQCHFAGLLLKNNQA